MRKINIFGRPIPVIAIIAMVLMVGIVSATVYHYAVIMGTVKVEEPVITTSPIHRYTITMNASSIEDRRITITSTKNVTVDIIVLPGNEATLDVWGEYLIVYPGNDTVRLTAGVEHTEWILHYASEHLDPGDYSVKVMIVD